MADPTRYEIETMVEAMNRHGVPEHLRNGLSAYLLQGRNPANFLRAVLENDLRNSHLRADRISKERISQIVAFLFWEADARSWGSPELVEAWINLHQSRRAGLST